MSKASKSKSPQPKGQEPANTFEDELKNLTQINHTTATPQGSAKKSQKNAPKPEASPVPSKGNKSAQKSLQASVQKQKTPLKNTPIQQEENNDSPDLEQEYLNELNFQVPPQQATPKGSVQKSNKNTPVQSQIKGSEQKSKKSLPGSAQISVNDVPEFAPEADEELIIAEENIKTPQQSAKKSVKNATAQKSQQKSVPASMKKSATPVPAFEPEAEEEEVTRTPQQSAKKSLKNTPIQSRPTSAKKQATPAQEFEEEEEEVVEEKQLTPKQSANKSNKITPKAEVNGKVSQQKSAQKQNTLAKEDIEIEDEEGEDEMEEEIADEVADEDDDDDLGIDNFDEEDLQAGENEEEAEEIDEEEKQRIKEENIRKAIEFRESQEKKGVVYLSSLPPYMKVSQLRKLFSDYGVERIYLNPEDESKRKFRAKTGGNKRRSYTEGWMEFNDKKKAKYVAAAFNNQKIGGKRRSFYTEDTLNLKYLPKFKWENLTEKINYDTKMRKEKMRIELALAKKQHDHYLEQVEKGKKIMGIKKSKDAKRAALNDIDEVLKSAVEEEEPEMKVSFDDEKDRIRRTFKQKKPKNH